MAARPPAAPWRVAALRAAEGDDLARRVHAACCGLTNTSTDIAQALYRLAG